MAPLAPDEKAWLLCVVGSSARGPFVLAAPRVKTLNMGDINSRDLVYYSVLDGSYSDSLNSELLPQNGGSRWLGCIIETKTFRETLFGVAL